MATIEEVRKQLDIALEEHRKAVEKLERLEKLRGGEKEKYIGERENLERKEEELEKKEKEWGEQVRYLQKKLADFGGGEGEDISTQIEEIKESTKRQAEDIRDVLIQMKRVKFSIEEWKTCPTVNTEAEKGRFIRNTGNLIEFPFEISINLDMSKHRKGKFLNPPDSDEEEDSYQEFFMEQCKGLIKHLNVDLCAYDSHNVSLLDSRKPDVVFTRKGLSLDPLNVEIVLELKTKRKNEFKNEDLGHIAAFAEKALQLQPQRSFIYGVLTDCYDVMFIKVQRSTIFSEDSTDKFKYEFTKKELLKYGNQGWNFFATLLMQKSDELGWIKQKLFYEEHGSITLKRCIGHGRTCYVFSGESHYSTIVAVKILKNKEDHIEREVKILKKLEDLKSLNIPPVLFSNSISIVMPLYERVNNLQKKDISPLIKTVQMVHNSGILHRDLRKCNLLRDTNSGNIVICDWGCSVFNDEPNYFAGGLEVAADDILQNLIEEKNEFIYDCQFDLVSIVRTFYLMLHCPILERLTFKEQWFNYNEIIISNAKRILEFWKENATSNQWRILYQKASELDYNGLISGLEYFF